MDRGMVPACVEDRVDGFDRSCSHSLPLILGLRTSNRTPH